MKLKNLILLMTATVAASSLSSCKEEPYVITREEQYARDFIKTFGIIAEGHDWTAAQHTDVTVKTQTSTKVKIYADYNGETYLFGNYDVNPGSSTLKFDIPKGATNICLKANDRRIAFTPGQTVDISSQSSNGSRTITDPGTYGDLTFSQSEPIIFDPKVVLTEFLKFIPEEEINIRNVTSNFNFISKGEPLTIYPVYWNTSSFHALGVYWHDEGEDFSNAKMQDLYYTKSNEITQSKDYQWEGEEPGGTFVACNPKSNYPYYISDVKALKTKGLTIQFPEGVHFGFYLKVHYENTLNPKNFDNLPEEKRGQLRHIVFSESELNLRYSSQPDNIYLENGKYTPIARDESLNWSSDYHGSSYVSDNPWESVSSVKERLGEIINPSENYCGASFKTLTGTDGNKYTLFAFEDWRMLPDLNDCIFMFGKEFDPEEDVIVVDHDDPDPEDKPFRWIVACEDLGGADDYDFNDVVFGVEHVSGEREVYVTALAAGGTLETHLMFNGTEIIGGKKGSYGDTEFGQYTADGSGKTFKEWHQWFGSNSFTNMINTTSFSKVGATVVLVLPKDTEFSMANTAQDTGKFGGFSVKVINNNQEITEISAPAINDTNGVNTENTFPQMFVTTVDYKWPTERTSIYYSHQGNKDIKEVKTIKLNGSDYKVYENSFHHWVQNNVDGFHTQKPTGNVITHGWKGYKK